MRYLLIIVLIFSTILADDKKQELTIGLGSFIQSQPYQGVGSNTIPTPVIFFDNSLIYIRWSRGGIYFLGDQSKDFSWGFSLTAQPRVYGYKAGDIDGMDKRENSWEGGLAFSAKTGNTYIEIMALHDLLNRYNSYILKAELGYNLIFDKISIYPSLIAVYQSSDFLNYYYGVKKEEELGSRKLYTPHAGVQLGVQTYINYPLTKKLSAFFNIRADKLPSQAYNSPIIDHKYIYSGLASLIYKFEY